jgi:hypothetical protein
MRAAIVRRIRRLIRNAFIAPRYDRGRDLARTADGSGNSARSTG